MDNNNRVFEKTEESDAEFQESEKSTGFEKFRTTVVSKLHTAADVLGAKAADQDPESRTAQVENYASEWLDKSAECIQNFDIKQTDSKVREYVRKKPGRSLLMAGAVGLVIGTFLRRR